jgi:hypothetical protein
MYKKLLKRELQAMPVEIREKVLKRKRHAFLPLFNWAMREVVCKKAVERCITFDDGSEYLNNQRVQEYDPSTVFCDYSEGHLCTVLRRVWLELKDEFLCMTRV